MSVLRQLNILGSMRLDVPHLRSVESSIAADFDVVAGRVQAGERALVVRGFTLTNFTAGTMATSLQLVTADGILYNMNASEAGTFLWVPADRDVEILNSATNARVDGSFAAGQVNYIGLDLRRTADATTSDLVQFLDPNTLLENPKTVPLGRTLDYRIVISTTPFSASPNLVPIAKVVTDANSNVSAATYSVQDARNIMWRLGSGGDFPNRYSSFNWAQNRTESVSGPTVFTGGDKAIESQKDWMDAIMTRLWELGGGENWYSGTADRNVRMVRNPGLVFASNGDNFEWVTSNLHWQGLKIVFDNANTGGVYYNSVVDQLGDLAGKTDLADGECIYVDIGRTGNVGVTAQKSTLQALSVPSTPGSRYVLAWRVNGNIHTRDASWPVNVLFMQPATTTVAGAVRLNETPNPVHAGAGVPTVATLNANNSVQIGAGPYFVSGSASAIIGWGGFVNGTGLDGHGGGTTGIGVTGWGASGGGWGGYFEGGGTGTGCVGEGSATGGMGVAGYGTIGQNGVYGSSDTGTGVYGSSGTSGLASFGVYGQGNSVTATGVYANGYTASIAGNFAGGLALNARGGDGYSSGGAGTVVGGDGGYLFGGNGNSSSGVSGAGGWGAWIQGGSGGGTGTRGAGGRGALIIGGSGGGSGATRGQGAAAIIAVGGDGGTAGAGAGINATGGSGSGGGTAGGIGGIFRGGAHDDTPGVGISVFGGTINLFGNGNGATAAIFQGGAAGGFSANGGNGITATGGTKAGVGTSGYGAYLTGGASGGGGLFATPGGNGNAIDATVTAGTGRGVNVSMGAATTGNGIAVSLIAGSTGPGILVLPNGSGAGISVSVTGTGYGAYILGGGSAPALRVEAGNTQIGISALGSNTQPAIVANGNSATQPALRATGSSAKPGIHANSSVNSVPVIQSDGFIDLAGASTPATTAGDKTLTPQGVLRASCRFTVTAGPYAITTNSSFNLNSAPTIDVGGLVVIVTLEHVVGTECIVQFTPFNNTGANYGATFVVSAVDNLGPGSRTRVVLLSINTTTGAGAPAIANVGGFLSVYSMN